MFDALLDMRRREPARDRCLRLDFSEQWYAADGRLRDGQIRQDMTAVAPFSIPFPGVFHLPRSSAISLNPIASMPGANG